MIAITIPERCPVLCGKKKQINWNNHLGSFLKEMRSPSSLSEWCKIWLAPTFVILLKFQTSIIDSVNIFQALNIFIDAEILSWSKWHDPCAVTERTLLNFSHKLCQLWVCPTAIEYLEKTTTKGKSGCSAVRIEIMS